MANLSHLEKQYFEDLFGMASGYVMDFSDRTFAEFFCGTLRINIDDPKYGCQSKAKRLRAFWITESDAIVGKALDELLKIWVYNQPDESKAANDPTYLKSSKTVDRLLKRQSTSQATEEDFLSNSPLPEAVVYPD